MTVKEIFETMEYGPAPEATKEAMAWINAKNAHFVNLLMGYLQSRAKGSIALTLQLVKNLPPSLKQHKKT